MAALAFDVLCFDVGECQLQQRCITFDAHEKRGKASAMVFTQVVSAFQRTELTSVQ